MPTPVDLADLVLEDPEGRPVRFGDVVGELTVVDLVRYYGCSPCRAFLQELADSHSYIRGRGGAALGVGPAAAYQAEMLARKGIPFPLLLDPEQRLADAIDLRRQSLIQFLFDLRGWWRWLGSWLRGGRQGAITAGWSTLPAVLLLDANSRVVWVHRGRFLGDYPPLREVLEHFDRLIDAGPRP